jgi:Arc/MetJ-type ribon-helix-helix transcriptional regulator
LPGQQGDHSSNAHSLGRSDSPDRSQNVIVDVDSGPHARSFKENIAQSSPSINGFCARGGFPILFCRNLRGGVESMEVQLSSDQRAFARHAVETGRLQSEEAAVEEALALWEERERRRAEFRATIEEARASLARGEGREITQESIRELSAEVRVRGRAHLLGAEEWSRELAAWSESHTTATPLLPDEAIDRNSIYGARGL